MKIGKFILPLFALTMLASCGNNSSTPASSAPAQTSEPSSAQATSEPAPTFEAFTLAKLHEARVNKTLANLDKKYVSIKGKVTFAKRKDDDHYALFIQDGKNAVEVSYPEPYTVNVGDAVEVKGRFMHNVSGGVDTIFVSTFKSVDPYFDIKVIDEAISTETVTITKDAELIEFDSSTAEVQFTVTGNRTNAAFVGKLNEGEKDIIVANMLGVADPFDEAPYTEGQRVQYEGVYTYTTAFRYADREGFSKLK